MNTENRINLDNYEVVRQDFFVTCEEPQLTFNQGRMYVNSYCVKRFKEIEYIQVLVDKIQKIVVIKLLEKKKKDSFRWCTQGEKRKARHMRCVPLFSTLFKRMNWDVDARYRITGTIEEANGEQVIVFPLKEAQCFVAVATDEKSGCKIYQKQMPKKWETTFGVSTRDYGDGEYILRYEEDGVYEVELTFSQEMVSKVKNANEIVEKVVE